MQLKQANAKLDGDNNDVKRHWNALTNALIDLVPHKESGKKTSQAVVRTCLYAIAPAYLWQFFSSQGKSGSKRSSFVKDMSNIYKAMMTAVASSIKLDKDTIVTAISDVIRSCQTRAESKKYLQQHPERLPKSCTPEASTIDSPLSDTNTSSPGVLSDNAPHTSSDESV